MSIHEMVTRTAYYKDKMPAGGKPLRLRFLGDVHLSAEGCDVDLLNQVLNRWKKDSKNALYFTMGDLNDFASGSERKALGDGSIHESTQAMFDKVARKHVMDLVKKCEFMRGQFIGSIEGNHKWEFGAKHGFMTSDQMFAQELGGEWLGGLGIVTLAYESRNNSSSKQVVLALRHGQAGGKLVGTSYNQVADMIRVVEADIYVQGHNHKAGALHGDERPYPKRARDTEHKVISTNHGFTAKAPLLCRSGSFLKTYVDNVPNYGVARGYPAAHLGALEVTVEFRRTPGRNATYYTVMNGTVVR